MKSYAKKKREEKYRKVQNELKVMAAKPGGWPKIDKRLSELKPTDQDTAVDLNENNIKSLNDWVVKEKKVRAEALTTELTGIDDFFKQEKEHPKSLRQTGLYKKGLPIGAPMYDTVLESNECQLEECKIKLEVGFETVNPNYAFMNDPRWEKLMEKITKRQQSALEKQQKELNKKLAEVEEEIKKEKEEKVTRIAQIKDELKELGQEFPKDKLLHMAK